MHYVLLGNNADQLRTIFVTFFPYKLAGFCTTIFQIFLPNFRPSKNHCVMKSPNEILYVFELSVRKIWINFEGHQRIILCTNLWKECSKSLYNFNGQLEIWPWRLHNSDFQSQFSTSKIIWIVPYFFSLINMKLGAQLSLMIFFV